MQVSVENGSGLERKLKVVVPAQTVESAYQKRITEFSKTAKLDGFRSGKIPTNVIEKRFGPSLRHEVTEKLMRENLFSAIQQEKLNPVDQPTIQSIVAEPEKDLEFEVSLEVYPEIDLTELEGKEVEVISSKINDQDLEDVIDKLRKQRAEWIEIDRAAALGDQVTIDFDGYDGDKPIEKGKAENVPLELGSKTMIPGFEDGIIGAKAGDDLEVHVTFPENYQEKSLANKPVLFKMHVHKVCEPKLPTLDDKFAEQFGVKEGGLDTLKKDLTKHLTRELTNLLKSRNKHAVFTKFTEANTNVSLPKALVDSELKGLHEQSHKHQHKEGEKHQCELTEEERKILMPEAERRVKLGLLVNALIKKHNLKPDENRVRELISEIAGGYENSEEFMRWYTNDQKRVAEVQMMAVEDQAIDQLLVSAIVKKKELPYAELIAGR